MFTRYATMVTVNVERVTGGVDSKEIVNQVCVSKSARSACGMCVHACFLLA